MDINEQEALANRLIDSFEGDLEKSKNYLDVINTKRIRPVAFSVPENTPVVIDVKNITKTYKLGKQSISALKGVSLQIKQGEFIALTGSSGSGKSTLLQIIGGLDKPTSGTVTVAGQELSKLSDRHLSTYRNKTVGFVFQFFYLQPFLTIHKNLEVPAMFSREKMKLRKEWVEKLSQAVGIGDRLEHLPRELSGGQMQRTAIARALLNQPKVLLADEPTGNLDSVNSEAIISLFEQVRREFGTTIIIVTHDNGIANRADRRYVLHDGALI